MPTIQCYSTTLWCQSEIIQKDEWKGRGWSGGGWGRWGWRCKCCVVHSAGDSCCCCWGGLWEHHSSVQMPEAIHPITRPSGKIPLSHCLSGFHFNCFPDRDSISCVSFVNTNTSPTCPHAPICSRNSPTQHLQYDAFVSLVWMLLLLRQTIFGFREFR